MVFSIVWLMIMRQDNTFVNVRELGFPLLAGFTLALLMILAIDLFRFEPSWFVVVIHMQFTKQPSLSDHPIPFDGCGGYIQQIRNILDAQTSEVTHLDNFCLSWIHFSKSV